MGQSWYHCVYFVWSSFASNHIFLVLKLHTFSGNAFIEPRYNSDSVERGELQKIKNHLKSHRDDGIFSNFGNNPLNEAALRGSKFQSNEGVCDILPNVLKDNDHKVDAMLVRPQTNEVALSQMKLKLNAAKMPQDMHKDNTNQQRWSQPIQSYVSKRMKETKDDIPLLSRVMVRHYGAKVEEFISSREQDLLHSNKLEDQDFSEYRSCSLKKYRIRGRTF